MNLAHQVTAVEFANAAATSQAGGLLGYARVTVAGLVIDGIAVRRRRDGGLTLSFPRRRDRRGRDRHVVRPVDDFARRAIEAAVFAALDLNGESNRA